MTLPCEVVAAGIAVMALLMAVALCAMAGRADASAAASAAEVRDARRAAAERDAARRAEEGGDDATAAAARAALRGRCAWVFCGPASQESVRRAGRDGVAATAAGEALALRVAGLALDAGVPVVVPTAPRGALDGAAFVGVAIPFDDGRVGALVVAGGAGLAARPGMAQALQELAVERAERRAVKADAAGAQERRDRFARPVSRSL